MRSERFIAAFFLAALAACGPAQVRHEKAGLQRTCEALDLLVDAERLQVQQLRTVRDGIEAQASGKTATSLTPEQARAGIANLDKDIAEHEWVIADAQNDQRTQKCPAHS